MDKNDSTTNGLPYLDNTQPPPYNQIQSNIPQPYLPPSQIASPTQHIPNNGHTYLARSGIWKKFIQDLKIYFDSYYIKKVCHYQLMGT